MNSYCPVPQYVGSQYSNLTRAYPPGQLMTVPSNCFYHGGPLVDDRGSSVAGRSWLPLRIKDLMNPPQNWISDQGCFWQFPPGGGDRDGPLTSPNGTDMAATPMLSIPPDILTLDPAWVSAVCVTNAANDWAFNDPPRVLTPVTAMVPKTTKASSSSLSDPLSSDPDPAPASGPATTPASRTPPRVTRRP